GSGRRRLLAFVRVRALFLFVAWPLAPARSDEPEQRRGQAPRDTRSLESAHFPSVRRPPGCVAALAGRGKARVYAERRQRPAYPGARRECIGHTRPTSNTGMQVGGGVMHARELFPGLLAAGPELVEILQRSKHPATGVGPFGAPRQPRPAGHELLALRRRLGILARQGNLVGQRERLARERLSSADERVERVARDGRDGRDSYGLAQPQVQAQGLDVALR